MLMHGQQVLKQGLGLPDLGFGDQVVVQLADLLVYLEDFPRYTVKIQAVIAGVAALIGLDGLVYAIVVEAGLEGPGIGLPLILGHTLLQNGFVPAEILEQETGALIRISAGGLLQAACEVAMQLACPVNQVRKGFDLHALILGSE